jgi:hypothetical protein
VHQNWYRISFTFALCSHGATCTCNAKQFALHIIET